MNVHTNATRWVVAFAALAGTVALVGLANSSSSDVAAQATLALLIAGTGVLGFLWRRWWWIPALVVGGTVATMHAAALWFGIAEHNVHVPNGWWGTVTLLILIVPAAIAGALGAWLQRSTDRHPRAGTTARPR